MTFLTSNQISKDIRSNPELKRVGYQRVEHIDPHIQAKHYMFRDYIHDNMIDMDDPNISQSVKDQIEYVIDISDPHHHKLEFSVKRNETRAQEQLKLRSEIIEKEKAQGVYDERIDKNVLFLYIDNISRANFERRLKKTAKWLEQFVDNEDSEYQTYQFFRYHSVFYNTEYTSAAMYYGQIKQVSNTSNNIFNSYSRNGYVTAFFQDI